MLCGIHSGARNPGSKCAEESEDVSAWRLRCLGPQRGEIAAMGWLGVLFEVSATGMLVLVLALLESTEATRRVQATAVADEAFGAGKAGREL